MTDKSMADALTRQMAGQWQGLMQMMTQQGASRDDIADMALSAAVVVLTQTADALWGSPHNASTIEEFDLCTRFIEAEAIINNALEELRGSKQEEEAKSSDG